MKEDPCQLKYLAKSMKNVVNNRGHSVKIIFGHLDIFAILEIFCWVIFVRSSDPVPCGMIQHFFSSKCNLFWTWQFGGTFERACLKFSEYYNMLLNPIGKAKTPIIFYGLNTE